MDQATLRTSFSTNVPAGALFKHSNPELSIPCTVAIEALTEAQIKSLIEQVQIKIGGKLFRDIELFMETYRDYKKAIEQPYNWIYHAYLRLTLRSDGVLRISADNRPFGDNSCGGTIYDVEQFEALISQVKCEATNS